MNAPELSFTNASQNQFGWIIGAGVGAVAFGGIALALAPIAVPAIGVGAAAIGLGALSSTAIGVGLVASSATIGAIAGVFTEPVIKNFFEDCFRGGGDKKKSNATTSVQASAMPPAPAQTPDMPPAPGQALAPPSAPAQALAPPSAQVQTAPSPSPQTFLAVREVLNFYRSNRFEAIEKFLSQSESDMHIASFNRFTEKTKGIFEMSNKKEFNLVNQYEKKLQNLGIYSALPPSSMKLQPAEQVEAKQLYYFHQLCLGVLESEASPENKKIALKAIILEEQHTRKQDDFGKFHKNFVANFFEKNTNKKTIDFASLIKEKGKVLAGEINAYQASENEKIFANGIFKHSMYSDPEIAECARKIHSQSSRSR